MIKTKQLQKLILFAFSSFFAFSLNGMAGPAVPTAAPNLKNFNFNAAAVLPYTRWKPKAQGGNAYFLLSRETGGKIGDVGTYDTFGGKRDLITDQKTGKKILEPHPLVTAAREFSEESFFFSPAEAEKYIDIDAGNTLYVIASSNKNYVTYITKFSPDKLTGFTKKFYNKLAQIGKSEKDSLAWVKWSNLERAIANSVPGSKTPVKVWANVIKPNGTKVAKQITLRGILVGSLRPFFQGAHYTPGKNQKIRFY